ncbi:MAG: hypothetical protein U0T02_10760 [Solirubrobacteraceae bacterium]
MTDQPPKRRLMALIDPSGKTPEQAADETVAAIRRYRETKAKAELELEHEDDQP